MSQYRQGYEAERKVRELLRVDGYYTMRAAGSKGEVDVLALKPGELLFVQVKRNGLLPLREWNALYEIATWANAIPLLATVAPRKSVTFHRLLSRKTPRQSPPPYEPFLLDRVVAQLEDR